MEFFIHNECKGERLPHSLWAQTPQKFVLWLLREPQKERPSTP